jgi:outer membrane protein OmpA-like peptidoglycan-associated protein
MLMKKISHLSFLLVVFVVALGGTGCKKTPKKPTPIPSGSGAVVGYPGMESGGIYDEDVSTGGFGEGDNGDLTPIDGQGIPGADSDILAQMTADLDYFASNTVYFDFDQSDIRLGEESKLEAIANYFVNNPTHHLLVEGHCDERGTEEYNRALGELRALSIREYLVRLSVGSNRIHTLSYGEDNPAVDGQNSDAHAQNRRGEFVLYTP